MPQEPRSRRTRASGSYRVEALAKGLRILDAFATAGPVLSLGEVVEMTGLPMPTAFRLVATLEDAGYLERELTGAYRPSLRVLPLGQASLEGSDVVSVARGPLRALADRTGQTVNLGVLSGDQVLYLIRQRNADLVTANLQVGSTLPAVYSSLGKVLLAFLGADELHSRLADWSFERPPGPHAVTSRAELERQLEQVQKSGYAVQDQEVAAGLRAVAAPIRNRDGRVVAAMNLAVKAADCTLEHLLDSYKEPVLAVASEISTRLGYR